MDVYYRAGLDELCHEIGVDTLNISLVKEFTKSYDLFKLLYSSIFLSCWLAYTAQSAGPHSISSFRTYMGEKQKEHPNIQFWWKFLSVNAAAFFALRRASREGIKMSYYVNYLTYII